MLILAWDTATPSLKLALVEWTDLRSFKTLALYDGDGLASHGQTLAPLVQEVLTQNTLTPKELDLLAVGLGPGSFTGLRVGLALAKGLSFALKIPALGFSTLAVLAAGMESGYV
ncbi:MAG: tRNA (adenosine(37)-N6)-threonylcarbamoyltransferase complex dimerization subunit type 1 TsaB, partial [Deltaproteobacteria bacterium]|nr:tRNA (adenosine(37)-N6)-threonylcarbamoyltransferase complex dimerization subunit type 1 TsaB [Deltaproteobacteria bacterium]